jgi:PAS domain S-box-containing protein
MNAGRLGVALIGALDPERERLARALAGSEPPIDLVSRPDGTSLQSIDTAELPVALLMARGSAVSDFSRASVPPGAGPALVLLAETLTPEEVGALLRFGAADCLTWADVDSGVLPFSLRRAVAREASRINRAPSADEQYRHLADQAPVMIWMDDHNRKGIYANKAICEFTGYPMEQVIGPNWPDLLHPDDRERITSQYALHRQAQVPFTSEFRFRRHDGAYRWVLEFGSPRFDGAGAFAGYIGSLVEVSDIREATDALRDSEARYRSVISALQEGITVQGPDTEILACNESACRILGLTEDQMTGRTSLDPRWRAVHADGRPFPGEAHPVTVTLRTGLSCTGVIMGIHKPDGSLSWIRVNSEPLIRPGETRPYAVVASFTDITESLLAEQALTEMSERYRAFVSQSTEGIFRVEFGEPVSMSQPPEAQLARMLDSGRIAECNLAFARLHGASVINEIVGQPLRAVVSAEDSRQREFWLDLIRAGYRVIERESVVTKAGAPVRYLLSSLIGFVEQGYLVRLWGMQRDITEWKALEEQLRHSQKMEGIGRLAGGVAHDFNNLLTAIIGSAELVLEREGLDPEVREDVEEVRHAARRAANLTQQLLAFSRRQVLIPKLLDVNEVVRNADRMLRRLLGEHVLLLTNLNDQIGTIRADPGQLEQVIVNLLVNARDAMPTGGTIRLETSQVELDQSQVSEWPGMQPGRYILLTVKDGGEGMSPETLLHLFEPFYTTKDPGKGTGLGLATVYGIVKQSGGFIYAESRRGVGSTFFIYLPLVEGATAEELEPSPQNLPLRPARETVLLVEDEEVVRRLSRRVLEGRGYRVLEAGHGAEALQISTSWQDPIDVLVTDLVMPGVSGQVLAELVQGERPDIKIVYMSGYTPDVIVQHGELPPGAIFLQKPFAPAALLAALEEVLAGPTVPRVRSTAVESPSSRSK